jgi:DNA-binding transcriptional ArsR family regulator
MSGSPSGLAGCTSDSALTLRGITVARSSAARKINTKLEHERSTRPSSAAPASEIATSLDRLLHDRIRLGIVSALAAADMSFTDLKSALNATDGNLSVHARKLEDAGYVSCEKTLSGRTPRTAYKLTASGRRALEKYLDHMDAIIRAARNS